MVVRAGDEHEVRARAVRVLDVRGGARTARADAVAVEEPLAIRVGGRDLAITMRTPGEDAELALGFLVGEGLVDGPRDVAHVAASDDAVDLTLAEGVEVPWGRVARSFVATSACGLCGKASARDLLAPRGPRAEAAARAGAATLFAARVVQGMPDALRAAQATFAQTGGLHAAGLFAATGSLVLAREDVGRHNAVDKLVGAALAGDVGLAGRLVLVSGRASFELVQKVYMAGAAALAAVGAPSSAAVELARDTGTVLLGFVRDGRCNVYAGEERVT